MTREKDYLSVDVVGTVITDPKPNKAGYSFFLENHNRDEINLFFVVVRSAEPIDVNKDDRVFISKAGFFVREGKNCLAVIEGSNVEVIRARCNLGTETV